MARPSLQDGVAGDAGMASQEICHELSSNGVVDPVGCHVVLKSFRKVPGSLSLPANPAQGLLDTPLGPERHGSCTQLRQKISCLLQPVGIQDGSDRLTMVN